MNFYLLIVQQHLKLTKIINKETLSFLKENTVIGNAARGDVVDDDAMVEALKKWQSICLWFDVYNGEPKIHPEYLKLKNIFLLPHLEVRLKEQVGYGLQSNSKS